MTGDCFDTCNGHTPEFGAGFDFTRDLRDPALRQRLREMGYDGEPVLPVVDPTSIGEMWERTNGLTGRYLIAVAHADGWRLAWLEIPA